MRLLPILLIMAISFLIAGCAENEQAIKDKIKNDLIGKEITYYGIAGNAIAYNVTEEDIKSIEKINSSELKQQVWKARAGNALAWDFYYDEKGNFIKKEQLFVT